MPRQFNALSVDRKRFNLCPAKIDTDAHPCICSFA
jgi:hypothetical protein